MAFEEQNNLNYDFEMGLEMIYIGLLLGFSLFILPL